MGHFFGASVTNIALVSFTIAIVVDFIAAFFDAGLIGRTMLLVVRVVAKLPAFGALAELACTLANTVLLETGWWGQAIINFAIAIVVDAITHLFRWKDSSFAFAPRAIATSLFAFFTGRGVYAAFAFGCIFASTAFVNVAVTIVVFQVAERGVFFTFFLGYIGVGIAFVFAGKPAFGTSAGLLGAFTHSILFFAGRRC